MATTKWNLDTTHSSLEFSVKHMMITTVRGRFKDWSANILVDTDDPNASSVEAEAEAASIDTGVADRDAHLRSADFLDVEKYPKIAFRSTRVEGAHSTQGDHFKVDGELTIRDTTLDISLDCVFEGTGKDPWGNERAAFTASATIDRRDWGLKWNQAIETGGILVANNVKIEAEVQCVRAEEAPGATAQPQEQAGSEARE